MGLYLHVFWFIHIFQKNHEAHLRRSHLPGQLNSLCINREIYFDRGILYWVIMDEHHFNNKRIIFQKNWILSNNKNSVQTNKTNKAFDSRNTLFFISTRNFYFLGRTRFLYDTQHKCQLNNVKKYSKNI